MWTSQKSKRKFFFVEVQEIRYYLEIATFDASDSSLQEKVLAAVDSVVATYVNGSHSTVEQLSFYDRLHIKSNQALERFNRFKNRKAREKANGGAITGKQIFLSQTLTCRANYVSDFVFF